MKSIADDLTSLTSRPRFDSRWYWTKLANLGGAALVLRVAGGDDTKAARIHAWAQNPEYRGKETLVAQLYKVQDLASTLRAAVPGSSAARKALTELRALSERLAEHRTAFTALPPRTIVDSPPDPMRPVPNLKNLNAQAKAALPTALVADMKARGFEYLNTATLVNIRHGPTDGNKIGGYFAGGLRGPWGAQLTAEGKDAASRLVPELKTIAPYIGAVIVSPTDRALETYRRATQGVSFPKNTPVTVVQDFSEHHVGGLFGLKKPAKGSRTVVSKVDGLTYGRAALDGAVAIDKNPAGTDFVPSLVPYLPLEPREVVVRAEPKAESWTKMDLRVSQAVERDILPELAAGKNVLLVSHQFVIGSQDALFYHDAVSPGLGRDARATGHDVPNTAPQYWTMYVFRNAQTGKLVVVPAVAGQGQLAAPGVTPSGQTPKP
jgi:broad specificity phosphatase PhoE